jgi:hypothetical protein
MVSQRRACKGKGAKKPCLCPHLTLEHKPTLAGCINDSGDCFTSAATFGHIVWGLVENMSSGDSSGDDSEWSRSVRASTSYDGAPVHWQARSRSTSSSRSLDSETTWSLAGASPTIVNLELLHASKVTPGGKPGECPQVLQALPGLPLSEEAPSTSAEGSGDTSSNPRSFGSVHSDMGVCNSDRIWSGIAVSGQDEEWEHAAKQEQGSLTLQEKRVLRTTVMLCNLPEKLPRECFLKAMNTAGLSARYDFVNFPMDFKTRRHFGYAFVNLLTHADAMAFWEYFEGFRAWPTPSAEGAIVRWGTHDGFDENVAHYRDSPVMHPAIPDECKPVVFADGVRVPFPAPTKTMRHPRIRRDGRWQATRQK